MGGTEMIKFTGRWFRGLSDEALKVEREKVQQEYCPPGKDDYTSTILWERLRQFNKEEQRRQNTDYSEYKFPAHGEHGTHLFDDE